MEKPRQSLRARWRAYRVRLRTRYPAIRRYLVVLLLVTAFLIVFFWPLLWNRVFVSLKPGEAGVLWERFMGGTDLDYIYREGFHLVAPWNRMYIYNMRLQQTPHTIIALCKNGLPVEIEVSIRSRPQAESLPLLHTVVGPDYIETIVKPEIQAHVRAVVSQFEPQELYTSEGYILNLILQGAMSEISERYISLDDLLIKRIILPEAISDAIEAKLTQEQQVLEYAFRVDKEKKEAERKEIEAQGILAFQETVASGGSFKDYLRFSGIAATVELAKSNNAKVVVIGGSDGGLPLILNMPSSEIGALDPEMPLGIGGATASTGLNPPPVESPPANAPSPKR